MNQNHDHYPDHAILTSLIREELARGGRPLLTVVTDSMKPLLIPGDQVVIEAVTPAMLDRGDVIVVSMPQEFITHRLVTVEASSKRIFTRGDRSTRLDPPVSFERLLGRVAHRRRKGQQLDLTSRRGRFGSRFLGHLAHIRESIAARTPAFLLRPLRGFFQVAAIIWAKIFL